MDSGDAVVPDLVGLLVSQSRDVGHDAAVVVTSSQLNGPPLGALTWPGRWSVVGQEPGAGTRVRRWAVVQVAVVDEGNGGAGVREPRRPPPGAGVASRAGEAAPLPNTL